MRVGHPLSREARKGVDLPLPDYIERGVAVGRDLRARRSRWNEKTDDAYALPTEIWRETVARRQRCTEIRNKIAAGEITDIHDFITYNLDIRAFAEDVLRVLLKEGSQPVVMVLARKLWRVVPPEYSGSIDAGRLLVVSPVSQNINRVSEELALVRNRFILQNCASAMFASIDPGGSLGRLLAEFPNLPYGVLSEMRENQ